MKVKTSDLTGAPLAWAVAQVLKLEIEIHKTVNETVIFYENELFFPDIYWHQGGPIIEREGIAVMRIEDRQAHQQWAAGEHDSEYDRFWEVVCGPTPLTAAMRCFVASRLGDEVDVPDDLVWDELIYEKEDE